MLKSLIKSLQKIEDKLFYDGYTHNVDIDLAKLFTKLFVKYPHAAIDCQSYYFKEYNYDKVKFEAIIYQDDTKQKIIARSGVIMPCFENNPFDEELYLRNCTRYALHKINIFYDDYGFFTKIKYRIRNKLNMD